MKKEILINSTSNEVRIAITEEGKLVELFLRKSGSKLEMLATFIWGKVAR